MTRGGCLLGAAVFGAGIGGSALAAPITAAHLGPLGLGLANFAGGAVAPTAFVEWMPAAALAARKPGIDPGWLLGGRADDGPKASVGAGAADALSSLGGAAEALLSALLRLPVRDDALTLPAAEYLRRLPDGPGDAAADILIVTSSPAADQTAISRAGADPLVEYAVPALAAASLPAAGLLSFGLVRRRRRAAFVRRIRAASARNGLPSARRRSS